MAAESCWELLAGARVPNTRPRPHATLPNAPPSPMSSPGRMWAGLARRWATVSTQSMSGLHKGHRGGVPSARPVLLHAVIQALGAHLGPTETALGGFPHLM